MLVLTRRVGQSILLDELPLITVTRIKKGQVCLHIECDPLVKITRFELLSSEKQAAIRKRIADFRGAYNTSPTEQKELHELIAELKRCN